MSDDLISRKALIADMRSRKYIDKALCEIFETIVNDAPIAFDKEKVIEELRANMSAVQGISGQAVAFAFSDGYYNGIKDAIEIVEKGGI